MTNRWPDNRVCRLLGIAHPVIQGGMVYNSGANLAAAAGAILALAMSWMKFGKPEVGMSLNGALAGLVGITAGCANVTPGSAIII